jgi:hypothetical protein
MNRLRFPPLGDENVHLLLIEFSVGNTLDQTFVGQFLNELTKAHLPARAQRDPARLEHRNP